MYCHKKRRGTEGWRPLDHGSGCFIQLSKGRLDESDFVRELDN
jgi:hypothetical protein